MIKTYEKYAELFKALGDANRLQILDILCKCKCECCACNILEKFNFAQPTLSHHMKILCDCGIVNKRKMGKWMYYSINTKGCENVITLLKNLTLIANKDCCIKKKRG